MFDPDTTLESVRTNLDFIEYAADHPFNFGRVELYAGTPLLARMQAEGRCRGDYLQWDYDLATPEIERFYRLVMRCFAARNFGEDALANTIQGMRFDLEIVRRFHPEAHDAALFEQGRSLSRRLALDTVAILRELHEHVRVGSPDPRSHGSCRSPGPARARRRATGSRPDAGHRARARAAAWAEANRSPILATASPRPCNRPSRGRRDVMSDRKTLLPELLPAPPAGDRPGSVVAPPPSPVERVAEQARLMLQRFRALGPIAGAAMLGLHCCGYNVVDPLPPPPVQCTTLPMPFDKYRGDGGAQHPVNAGVDSVDLTLKGAAIAVCSVFASTPFASPAPHCSEKRTMRIRSVA